MSLLDTLRNQRNTPPSIWLQFVNLYQPDKNNAYVFFEGNEDHAYYMPELRRRWNGIGSVVPFNCKGKDGVLQSYTDDFGSRGKRGLLVFFIDKDIDDILGITAITAKTIYQTD